MARTSGRNGNGRSRSGNGSRGKASHGSRGGNNRGFAAMSPERRREIARKGGRASR